MKIRHCFVSNSSSSSFICDVCGIAEEAYYADECDMSQCVNGHIFCLEHAIGNLKEIEKFDGYSCPEEYCPICQMKHVTTKDMLSYMLAKYNTTPEQATNEINSRFTKYKDFREFVMRVDY